MDKNIIFTKEQLQKIIAEEIIEFLKKNGLIDQIVFRLEKEQERQLLSD